MTLELLRRSQDKTNIPDTLRRTANTLIANAASAMLSSVLEEGGAAVYVDGLAGHGAGGVGAEKQSGTRDFVRGLAQFGITLISTGGHG